MVMKYLESPISRTASSHLIMGNVKGLVTAFSFLYDTQSRQMYFDQCTCSWWGFAASTMGAPHGPSSSSMMPFFSSFSISSLIIFDSCGPYLGGLAHTGETSPVSTWNRAPRILFFTPSSAKTSQNSLISVSIFGRKSSGQSAHCMLFSNSCLCSDSLYLSTSVLGGSCVLFIHSGFPCSLYSISRSLSGSGTQSGSL